MLSLTAAIALSAAGCATTKDTGPPRMSVHVDTLDPALVKTFVDGRIKFVAHLRAHGDSDLRGTYLQIDDHTFFSLYPFHTWPDLSKHAAENLKRTTHVGKKEADEYDRDSDRSLVFPHKSEIWIEEPDLDYGKPTPTALLEANVASLQIEDVRTTMDQQYWGSWEPIAKALAQVKYPLQRVVYHSFYGSGRILSFWLAPSDAVLKAAPPIAQALALAVGEVRAAELLKAWRDCVIATESHDVIVRHDMASPP